MKKSIFSVFILLICAFCFSQTLVGKYEVKGFQYQVHTDFAENYPNQTQKEIYRISRVENDSIVQGVNIDKNVKNSVEEINSAFQVLDDVFVFEKQQILNGQIFYGVDRVFVGNSGKLYKHEEKYFSPNKPNLNTYDAQFPGGRRGLENWMMDRFNPHDFERYAKEGESAVKFIVKFSVGEDGKIGDIEIVGNEGAKVEAIKIMQKMPDWFPAVENGVKVKARQSMPVHMVLGY